MINGFYTSKQESDPSAATNAGTSDGWWTGQQFTAPGSGDITVTELWAYTRDNNDQMQLGIYADDGGSPGTPTGSVLGNTDTQTAGGGAAWVGSAGLSITGLTGGTKYWLGFISGSGGPRLYYDTTGGVSQAGAAGVSFPTWPSPPSSTARVFDIAIQAVYTAAGGARQRMILMA